MGRLEKYDYISVNYEPNGQEVLRLFKKAVSRAHLGRVCLPRENLLIDAINSDHTHTGSLELPFAMYFTDIDDRRCFEKKFFDGKNHLELSKQKGLEKEFTAAMATCDTGIAFAVEDMLSQQNARPANLRETLYFLMKNPAIVNWHPVVALGTQISTNNDLEVIRIYNMIEVVLDFKSKFFAHFGPSLNRHRSLVCSGFLVVL